MAKNGVVKGGKKKKADVRAREDKPVEEQPHGGALSRYGNPIGRPSNDIRKLVRGTFEERVPRLAALVDDPDTKGVVMVRAMDVLGKYAGLEKVNYDPDLVGELWQAVDLYVDDHDAKEAIKESWLATVAEYVG